MTSGVARTLADTGRGLLETIEAIHATRRLLEKTFVFAGMKSDEDTRIVGSVDELHLHDEAAERDESLRAVALERGCAGKEVHRLVEAGAVTIFEETGELIGCEHIMAERAMGASTGRILFRHVMPNIVAPLFILASMDVPVVVGMEAGLSFLGLGVSPPTASWGSILNDGYSYIRNSPWPIVAGGIPLILVTLGFTFFGESLRDILDPRLRKKG